MTKKIGILTFAVTKAGIVPLSNLISIFRPGYDVYLITDNEGFEHFKDADGVKAFNIRHKSYSNGIINLLNYLHKQLLISYRIIKDIRQVDTWIFFFNSETMVLPLITLKLSGKKVILSLPSSTEKIHSYTNQSQFFVLKALSKISHILADTIVVYSPSLIAEWNLSPYRHKIRIAHEHIINFNEFKQKIGDRKNLIGYVGRLDGEKGIMNLVGAMPAIVSHDPDVELLIIGDGNLKESVRDFIVENHLEHFVKLAGWVRHDELPAYLNSMKLLVIPSYTEGLPNTMLEAMACGTPVLANRVGSIPDFITDGQNGFIMKDNSFNGITQSITQILARSDLEKIGINGRKMVEDEFVFEATVKKYMDALMIR